MNDPDTIQFQRDSHGIDWQELVRLFQLAKMGGREGDKVRRGFENSTFVCFALDGHRLVGAARALSDGEYHATVYDVVVHPDYQRRGVGTRLMRELLAVLRVWRVLLVAEDDARPFYRRLGFEPFESVLARFDQGRLYDSF
jgi:aralkylamine N-acetyltransferase